MNGEGELQGARGRAGTGYVNQRVWQGHERELRGTLILGGSPSDDRQQRCCRNETRRLPRGLNIAAVATARTALPSWTGGLQHQTFTLGLLGSRLTRYIVAFVLGCIEAFMLRDIVAIMRAAMRLCRQGKEQ